MVDEKLTESYALLDALDETPGDTAAHIQRVLRIVRTHLEMDVGFLSEFSEGRRFFRHVDAGPGRPSPIAVGGSDPLEESYCQRVVDGRLPEIIPDACEIPEALILPPTRELPVGAHISVPLRLPDGRLYGTFCCFSYGADETLNERDLKMLRAFAAIAADLIQAEIDLRRARAEKFARISDVIARRSLRPFYQPIYQLHDARLAGFEALTRFSDTPYRSPDVWFGEAAEAGLATELEFLAVRLACDGLPLLPHDASLAVNFSPASILTQDFNALFETLPLDRIILEVTEHAAVVNYAELTAALSKFRERGLRLAVDDAGAGHSSFRHVLALRPNIIKLDMSLTRDIDRDPGRHALATALTTFGRTIGSQIVAEGVETQAELEALRRIGVAKVQGYLLGKPLPLAEAAVLPETGRFPQPRSRDTAVA
jgi:EAL domain-containing protein (putative c-di-GMP-specific phosphodiesterase class I)